MLVFDAVFAFCTGKTRLLSWTMRFKNQVMQSRRGPVRLRHIKVSWPFLTKKSCIHSVQESKVIRCWYNHSQYRTLITKIYSLATLFFSPNPCSRLGFHTTGQSARIAQLLRLDSREIAHPVSYHVHARRNHGMVNVTKMKGKRVVSACQAFLEGI